MGVPIEKFNRKLNEAERLLENSYEYAKAQSVFKHPVISDSNLVALANVLQSLKNIISQL